MSESTTTPVVETQNEAFATTLKGLADLLGGTVEKSGTWGGASHIRVGQARVSVYVSKNHFEVGAAGKRILEPVIASKGLSMVHRGRTSYRVVLPKDFPGQQATPEPAAAPEPEQEAKAEVKPAPRRSAAKK